jgi:hypothetical protein
MTHGTGFQACDVGSRTSDVKPGLVFRKQKTMFADSSSADMNERKALCEHLRATFEVFQNKTRESWESSQEMPKLEQADACKCSVARKLSGPWNV